MLTESVPGIATTPGPKKSPRTGSRLMPEAVIVMRRAEMRAVGDSIKPEPASAPGAVPMMMAFTRVSTSDETMTAMAGAKGAVTNPGMPVAVSVGAAAGGGATITATTRDAFVGSPEGVTARVTVSAKA